MLTPPPPAPTPNDPDGFNAAADARVAWESVNVDELNALQMDVTVKQATASSAASSAGTSASSAAASAAAAQSSANALPFSSSTSYTQGQSAISLLDQQTYRRKTAGTSSTDPKNDPSNWTRISGVPPTPTSVVTIAGSSDYQATNTVAGLIRLSISGKGRSFWLPDATTLNTVGVLYEISNTELNPVGIRDNQGKLLAVLEPGGRTIVDLVDNGSAAGVWSLQSSGSAAALFTLDVALSSTFTAAFPQQLVLTSTLSLHFVGGSSGFAALLVSYANPIAAQYGVSTPVTVSSTAGAAPLAVFPISATAAIVFFQESGALKAAVLTASGASFNPSLSVGTVATASTAGANDLTSTSTGETFTGTPKFVQLSSTLYAVAYRSSSNSVVSVSGFSVSGTTVSTGSVASAYTSTGTVFETQAYALTSTTALLVYTDNGASTTLRGQVVSVDPSTLAITSGTSVASAATAPGQFAPGVALLSTTKALVSLYANSLARVELLQVSGTTVTWAASPLTLSASPYAANSLAWTTGNPTPNRYARRFTALSSTKAFLWYVSVSLGSVGVVITESSGTLTAGALCYGVSGQSPTGEGLGAVIGVLSNAVLGAIDRGPTSGSTTIECAGSAIDSTAGTVSLGCGVRMPTALPGRTAGVSGAISMGDGRLLALIGTTAAELQMLRLNSAGQLSLAGVVKMPPVSIDLNSRPPVSTNRVVLLGVNNLGVRVLNLELVA